MSEFEKAIVSLIQKWRNGQYSAETVALTVNELVEYFHLEKSG